MNPFFPIRRRLAGLLLLLVSGVAAMSPTAHAQIVPIGDPGSGSNALEQRFLTGQAPGDTFGAAVATAGDVNGDGYDDVLVGALNNDAGGSNTGRAYVYFGGSILDTFADVTLTGEDDSDFFGTSVAPAGDVNGDGYADVIVGANNAGASGEGRAYVFLGGPGFAGLLDAATDADVVITGEAANDGFGTSVSSAGDVNGDGFSDVVVGATGNDAAGNNAGRAYVFFGGASMDNAADVIMTGEAASDLFGSSVSSAGDTNGDGYADVIVGANNAGPNGEGRAYVYLGSAAMDNAADVTMTGEAAGDTFGQSVSSAGDTNGDGFSDVVVGAIANDAGGVDAGRAYVYYGGASMDATPDVTMTGQAAGDRFGFSVSSAGDMNGDGYADALVGAWFNDAGGPDAGRAYVFFGAAVMDAIADVQVTGEAGGDRFGQSVSSAGDVDGDGYTDVVVGAPGNDTNGAEAGRAYVYLNSLTGPDIPDEFFTGEAAFNAFGFSVSSAGDVNGDGYADVLVGAPANDTGGMDAGRAYVFFGGATMDATPDVVMTGETALDQFGRSVSSAGDVNGDGYADVLVGADGAGPNGEGRAYIFFGGPLMDNTADVVMTGEAALDEFGNSVSSAGDVNGDGYADVLVAGVDAGLNAEGRAYVFFGGAGFSGDLEAATDADVTITGEAVLEEFGFSVSSAGDVNGDGYADVLVGAPANDTGGMNAGRAYVFFGGAGFSGDLEAATDADVTMTDQANNVRFGQSVSTSGDVSGDGYADVIVGAMQAGPSAEGRAYVFFGGAGFSGDLDAATDADVTITGEATMDQFSNSVSSAGDINNDGFSDIVVGAWLNDTGGSNAGRAYVFFGGAGFSGDLDAATDADVTITGEAADDQFGFSVSSAGDVNGDGLDDTFVGAFANDAGGSNAGRAYLYLSSAPAIRPRITAVNDVPGDQGGFVHLTWTRSGYDAPHVNTVTQYLVERAEPPGPGGFAWEALATLPAVHNPFYSYTAATYSDQTSSNPGTTFFRVTAQTDHADAYWRSMPLAGASIDNLAPAPPMNAAVGESAGSTILLTWDPNTIDPDIADYVVYRDTTAGFTPQPANRIATTPTTAYEDTDTPFGAEVYYRLTTRDVHNNESDPTAELAPPVLILAHLKLLLEGPYNPATGLMTTALNAGGHLPTSHPFTGAPWQHAGAERVPPDDTDANGIADFFDTHSDVVDWVLVELRASDSGPALARTAALLRADGTLLDVTETTGARLAESADPYFVAVYHRNHLAVMTATSVALSPTSSLYDLTTAQEQAYGTNAMKALGGGVFGLFAGDGNATGGVTASDQAVWLGANGTAGYLVGDYNLSGGNTASDQAAWLSNNGTSTQVPDN